MKKLGLLIILLALTVCSIWCQDVQSQYVVSETKGVVKVKHENKDVERDVKRNMRIYSNDSIILQGGGYVSFYNSDNSNDKLYEFDQRGRYVVWRIVKEHNYNSLFKTYFSFLVDKKQETESDTRDFHNIGGLKRGLSSDYEKDIACLIKTTLNAGGLNKTSNNDAILFNKVMKTSAVFSFEMTNNTNDTLYMNIFRVLKKGKISCCYDVIYREENVGRNVMSIFVPNNCNVDYPNYTFINDKSTYILIGAKYPFDAEMVDSLVNDSNLDIKSSNYEGLYINLLQNK